MTSEQKFKQVYPDARCVGFGYLSGMVHIVTNEHSEARYKSQPFGMERPELAWEDAWRNIQKESPDGK